MNGGDIRADIGESPKTIENTVLATNSKTSPKEKRKEKDKKLRSKHKGGVDATKYYFYDCKYSI